MSELKILKEWVSFGDMTYLARYSIEQIDPMLPMAVIQRQYLSFITSAKEWDIGWECIVYNDDNFRVYSSTIKNKEEGMQLVDEWLVKNGWRLLDKEPELRLLV